MELKVEFNEAELKESSLRATILKGTVAHLLSVLTPEALQVFLEKTLADAVKGICSYDIQNAMRPHYEKIISEYVSLPPVKARLEAAVKAAVDGAVEACQELDREFPEARLLPSHSWSLGLSPNRIETLFYKRKENPDGTEG